MPTADPAAAPGGIGGLLVGPTRVVFEGNRRSAQLTLVNTGTGTATYRISLVRLRMNERGEFREVQTPDSTELFADSLVRFSPRRVELAPHVPQTVRLQLRLPGDLRPGEYRNHLLFRAVSESETQREPQPAGVNDIRFALRPVFGVSVPVIVRYGSLSANLSLSGLELVNVPNEDPPTKLRVVMNRTGNQSVYGSLTATLVRRDGSQQVVGLAKGIAVYTPNARRIFELPLHLPLEIGAQTRLQVAFSAPGSNDAPLAEASLALR